MEFAVNLAHVSGVVVVTASGDVDIRVAEEFRSGVVEATQAAERRVVLDLGGVTFFDSAGLHVLDECEKIAAADGVEFALVLATPQLARLFQITGLVDRFEVHDTVERALDASL